MTLEWRGGGGFGCPHLPRGEPVYYLLTGNPEDPCTLTHLPGGESQPDNTTQFSHPAAINTALEFDNEQPFQKNNHVCCAQNGGNFA